MLPLETDGKKKTRGNVANYFGVAKNTLRNYETLGLVEPVKDDNDYRYFKEEDVSIITAIRMLRELGWSLPEIAHMVRECSLEEYAGEVRRQMEKLLRQQQELLERLNRVARLYAKVNRAMSAPSYEILEKGPVLLWQSREQYNREPERNWFSYMPGAGISGILTLEGEQLKKVETGLAMLEESAPAELDPSTVTRRLETGRCVHCIQPCYLKNGEYVPEDYRPILEYARSAGYEPLGWLITYGLAYTRAKSEPTFHLEIWLPVKEK